MLFNSVLIFFALFSRPLVFFFFYILYYYTFLYYVHQFPFSFSFPLNSYCQHNTKYAPCTLYRYVDTQYVSKFQLSILFLFYLQFMSILSYISFMQFRYVSNLFFSTIIIIYNTQYICIIYNKILT